MAYPPKITPEKKQEFLDLLAETGNVSKVCAALGVSRMHIYIHRKKNKTFEKKWALAKKLYIARLEDEAWRRAFEGITKPIFYKGEQLRRAPTPEFPEGEPYFERTYSDTLLMHRLNAERPNKYQYRQKIDGNIDGEIIVKVVKFSDKGR